MNFTLCARSSELGYPYKDVLRSADVKLNSAKSSVRVENVVRRDSGSEAGKAVVASNVVASSTFQGTIVGKKKLLDDSGLNLKQAVVRTLLIDNYDSYTYNVYQELSVINGLPPVVVRNDELSWEDLRRLLYDEKAFDNIVISPGPGSPTCPADIGISLQLLRECKDIPILGVCLGHQALGYAHGAKVVHASEPIHGRLSEIEHNGCELFHDIPSGPYSGFKVVRYHSLVIDEESLPNELIPIAWTTSSGVLSFLGTHQLDDNGLPLNTENGSYRSHKDPYEVKGGKVLMGIMHSTRPHFGLQFHPESIATCYGRQIFKNFREITENYWRRLKLPLLTNQMSFQFNERSQVPYYSNEILSEGVSADSQSIDEDSSSLPGMFSPANLSSTGTGGVKYVKLAWKKLDRFAGKVGGARNIFLELYGSRNADNTFWLDSSSTEKGRARFSFMGGQGGSLWKHLTYRVSDESVGTSKAGGCLTIDDAQGTSEETFLEGGFFDFLKKELLSIRYDEKDYEGLPFEFYGGYIGYIGYNLKVECGAVLNCHKSETPDACFFFADNLVAIDHLNDDVYVMSLHEGNAQPSWLEATEQNLLDLQSRVLIDEKEQTSPVLNSSPSEPDFACDKTIEEYVSDVEKCLEYIKDGESYELCLTTQLRKRIGDDVDLLGLYLHLREKNPAPYSAWLSFSREKLNICCSSPERFLRLDRDGVLEAKPIKGTMARGKTHVEDKQRKEQLQYSEKDQAENLMIVDLLRNDLGRVCAPGSVHVPCLMDVESYSTVHTMVSTIRGRKRDDITGIDCVRAAFPGGSMTGAPKLRSMELLDSLERRTRGVYSGSIGFFSYNQTFDLNIVIRTVVIHNGEASVGAGGAIVALSNPDDEYKEMILKTLAPTKAVTEFLSAE